MKRKRLNFPIILTMFVLLLMGCSAMSTPPQKATPALAGIVTDFPLVEKWCLQGSSLFSLPVYYDGLVYILINTGKDVSTIAAYDLQGNLIWAKEVKSSVTFALPGYWMFSSGYFLIMDDTSIITLNAGTGENIWSQPINFNKGMVVGDGKVFVSTIEEIIAFDLKTGKPVWKFPGPGRIGGKAPIYFENENRKLILIDQGTYKLVDALTGKVTYETRSTIDNGHSPYRNQSLVVGDKYIRPTNRGIEILDVLTGKLIKMIDGPSILFPQAIQMKGQSLFLNTPDSIAVFDLNLMKYSWQITFNSDKEKGGLKVISNPYEYRENIYVILSDSSIRAYELQNGVEVGRWQSEKAENKIGLLTTFVPGFGSSENMLFAAFGTNKICAFGEK